MEIALKDHRFTGEDLMCALELLERFVREAIIQGISETQAFIAIPTFLTGFKKFQYEAGVQMI